MSTHVTCACMHVYTYMCMPFLPSNSASAHGILGCLVVDISTIVRFDLVLFDLIPCENSSRTTSFSKTALPKVHLSFLSHTHANTHAQTCSHSMRSWCAKSASRRCLRKGLGPFPLHLALHACMRTLRSSAP